MRLIDVNIGSAYMGRFMTMIVFLLVLAITVSALIGKGRKHDYSTLVIEITESGEKPSNWNRFEPLRDLISRKTGRSVSLSSYSKQERSDGDLYIMETAEFMQIPGGHDLVPLYSLTAAENRRDSAILIMRAGKLEHTTPQPDQVMFTHPRSINGCWLQLVQLESSAPDSVSRIDQLSFGGPRRVIFSVLNDKARFGACRMSDLQELIDAGEIDREEISVVNSVPALPDLIIVCHAEDAVYFERIFKHIATRMADPGLEGRDRETVDLLKSRGLKTLLPVREDELNQLKDLFVYLEGRI